MTSTQAQRILKKNNQYSIKGSLWLECNGSRYFGPGPVELLTLIDETGSVRQAALQMGMSYKKASELVSTINENSVSPMVITKTGGNNGGGSVITPEAKKMIAFYAKLRTKFLRFLEAESKNLNL
ncbi:MAG: LysR family transcriptional regulator [Chitinophagaceae bacterium]|nr:MAG: LysR family transcriptional regulator [Chitinophagaceae bacterium]